MVNKVVLVGRLGRDPEMRYTGAGTAVANFSVATDERWNTRDGESQNRTEWHNIVVWSKLAEICNQYLTKGKLVYIEGRLQTRDWEDRDGNKRRTTEIVATEMKMLGARSEGPPRENDPPQRGEESDEGAKGSGEATGPMDVGITDDDIPF
jgi:single-strand DNA-binding protein